MKICMLLDNTFKPIDRRVYREAKSLVNFGYDVTIVCKKDHDNLLEESEVIDGIKVKRYFRCNLGTSILIDKYLEAHFDLMCNLNEKFDVYHCHDTETWPIGYILSKRDHAKFICDAHEYFPDYIEKVNYKDEIKYETSKILGLNRGAYIKYADCVITVGEKVANLLYKNYQLPQKPVAIYNTRNMTECVTNKRSLLRDEFSIEENKRILLFHGNIECARGIENIIDALTYVKSDIIFLMAGSCSKEYIKELFQYATQKHVNEKVKYIGFLSSDKLLEYISSADLNVYYPLVNTENMEWCVPNKFFEYIFATKPFVIKTLAELSELTQKYDVGYLADSVQDMAVKIDELLINKQEYSNKVQNLRDAQKDLCWEVEEQKLLQLYKNL